MSLKEKHEIIRIYLDSVKGEILQTDHTDFGKYIVPWIIVKVFYIEVEFGEIATVEEAERPREEERREEE